jgi:hypothetical protein
MKEKGGGGISRAVEMQKQEDGRKWSCEQEALMMLGAWWPAVGTGSLVSSTAGQGQHLIGRLADLLHRAGTPAILAR